MHLQHHGTPWISAGTDAPVPKYISSGSVPETPSGHDAVMLFDVESHQALDGRDGVERVKVETRILCRMPECLDEGIRVGHLDLGQNAPEAEARQERVNDTIHILDTRVRDNVRRLVRREILAGLDVPATISGDSFQAQITLVLGSSGDSEP